MSTTSVYTPSGLEILTLEGNLSKDGHPILFIHGFSAGAWMFEMNYFGFFSTRGHPVYALNLRGHGGSFGQDQLSRASLNDFYQDVTEAVDFVAKTAGRPPVLIGHSMGGVLTQKYIETHALPAAVIMSMGDVSIGMKHFMRWCMTHYFWLTLGMMVSGNSRKFFGKTRIQRAVLLAPNDHLDDQTIGKFIAQPGSEVVFKDLQRIKLTDCPRTTKTLLIAGDRDPIAPVRAIQSLSERYRCEHKIIDNKSHDLMLSSGWEKTAQYIINWLV